MGRRRLIRAGPQTGQMFTQFDFLLDADVRHLLVVSRAASEKRALNRFGEQSKGPVCIMQGRVELKCTSLFIYS